MAGGEDLLVLFPPGIGHFAWHQLAVELADDVLDRAAEGGGQLPVGVMEATVGALHVDHALDVVEHGVQQFLLLADLVFQPLLGGDVVGDPQHPDDRAVGIAQRFLDRPIGEGFTGGVDVVGFFAGDGFALAQHAQVGLAHDGAGFADVHEVGERLAQHGLQRSLAQQIQHKLVGVGVAPVLVGGVDECTDFIQQDAIRVEPCLRSDTHACLPWRPRAPCAWHRGRTGRPR